MNDFFKSKQPGNVNMLNQDKLHSKCIEEILALNFNKKNIKINSDALKRFTEVVKIFIAGAERSAVQAKNENIDSEIVEITPQHLEKILPHSLISKP
ncbi:uncharacterized protein LOC129216328 isoform X3 [Uloborus diversus]|uniref:uncharacterized protein LOC129216328 isoform X3 n=1 Tax=Uloborus diversus TaxID=327109 RepID=UPI002409F8C0|nr:uncharacterized protein LOC129216328 isoform X3 [Uloborus diversus]